MVEYYFVKCLFSKAVAGLNEAKSDMAMGFPTYDFQHIEGEIIITSILKVPKMNIYAKGSS
jgi:hypothetical protein